MPRTPSISLAQLHRVLRPLLALIALSLALPANAGSVYFSLDRTGDTLVITNLGNSSAFYPRVLRLNADGRWETLPAKPGKTFPAELASNAKFEARWTEPSLPAAALKDTPLAATQPMMIRFFDQAGSGFGQISFFNQPATSATVLPSTYEGGKLKLSPLPTIRTSWLLWAQEEGIAPLDRPVRFEHLQASAQRIDWHKQQEAWFSLGRGQPSAMLLHATPEGWQLQIVSSGGLQGREQRAAWLQAGYTFHQLATGAGAAALIAFIALLISLWRKRTKA